MPVCVSWGAVRGLGSGDAERSSTHPGSLRSWPRRWGRRRSAPPHWPGGRGPDGPSGCTVADR